MQLEMIFEKLKKTLEAQHIVEPLVFGVGDARARVMLIGEAPGAEEVKAGKPFVGKAGKNLNHFLEKTGIKRERLYITNVVKFRPYKIGKSGRKSNRPPTQREIAICLPCLQEEIASVAPRLIVTLGNTALGAVAEKTVKIGEAHGALQKNAVGNTLFPLYHPASIIYNRSLEEVYEKDMQKLRAYIKETKLFD
ncbi:MAG: uracil-DNA glycosylase [Christensenellaceae bacterium]|jgi:uracil-DNA glycosylase family 4